MKYAVVVFSKYDSGMTEFDTQEEAQKHYDNEAGKDTTEICYIYLMQILARKTDELNS